MELLPTGTVQGNRYCLHPYIANKLSENVHFEKSISKKRKSGYELIILLMYKYR